MATARTLPPPRARRKSLIAATLRWCFVLAFSAWLTAAFAVVGLRWFDPATTAVQAQRHVQAWVARKPYQKRYDFVPLDDISPQLQHAVVAAEDTRFYQHHGFDWKEIQVAMQDDLDDRRVRGASTITQQLVKNLFFGTGRSYVRKGAEATLVPVAEYVLGKRRILELYLNVVEWGPGVFGAEAASQYHYSISARNLNRGQALGLASILPAPLRRKPARMSKYAAVIDVRMRQMRW